MRTFLIIALVFAVAQGEAQVYLPGGYADFGYRSSVANNLRLSDTALSKKWSLSRYSSLSTSFSFFKGGSATVIAAPIGLQLNRRLSNNVYAFAGVSVAPAYVSFRTSFLNSGTSKFNNGNAFTQNSLGLNPRAELGLMYINDEKTFSISGSIGIERNSYPAPVYIPSNQLLNQPVGVRK